VQELATELLGIVIWRELRDRRSHLDAGRVYQVHAILNYRDPRLPHPRDLLHDLRFQQIVRVAKDDNFPMLCSKPKHMGAQLMGFRPEVSHHPALETFYDGSGGHRSSVIYDNHLLVRTLC
jgi:hypothetical protein